MVVDEDDEVMPAGSLALQAFDAIGAPACVARARLARMFRGSSLDRAHESPTAPRNTLGCSLGIGACRYCTLTPYSSLTLLS